jgi:anti-sigma B factor antagonist
VTGPMEIEHRGNVPVARLIGELDIAQAPFLRDRLLRAIENHHQGLVVDLTATTYLDSAVVNLLFEIAEQLQSHQLRLAVVVPEGGLVESVLTIVDLGGVADLHRTVDEALGTLGSS